MTCIVAIRDKDGVVWMGGDSAGVSGWEVTLTAQPKVFKLGNVLMGYTSSFRMGQLLQYALTLPEVDDDNLHRYMVTKFVNAVRECLKMGGYAKKENETETGGTFLVGIVGRLFRIEDDYQVYECMDDVDSVGSGEQYARGTLYANAHLTPKARIEQALGAAATYNMGVRGPFTVIHSDKHPKPAHTNGKVDLATEELAHA